MKLTDVHLAGATVNAVMSYLKRCRDKVLTSHGAGMLGLMMIMFVDDDDGDDDDDDDIVVLMMIRILLMVILFDVPPKCSTHFLVCRAGLIFRAPSAEACNWLHSSPGSKTQTTGRTCVPD